MDSQTALVAQGDSLIKLENDTQMQIAIQKPRDEGKILHAALKELDLYPSMAEEVLYNKPVGKDPETGKQKIVEGLSIRSAESLANRWSNSAYGIVLVEDDPTKDFAIIGASWVDYENNTRHAVQRRVSRFYTDRYKKTQLLAPDRFDTILMANGSKILREIILRSLPAGLKKEYENKARQLLKGEKLQNRRIAILQRFEPLQVTQADLEKYVAKPMKQWAHEQITSLLGLYNAIVDGETDIKEAFGKEEPKEQQKVEEAPLQVQGTIV